MIGLALRKGKSSRRLFFNMRVGDLVKHHHDHLTGKLNIGVVIGIEFVSTGHIGVVVLWSKPKLDAMIRKFPSDQLEVI